MSLIDTHCHLTDERLTGQREILAEAAECGVTKVIIPSTSLQDAQAAVKLAEETNQYCLVGIHPEEVEKIKNLDLEMEEIAKLARSNRVVGIGEIGLDFYYDTEKKTKEPQIKLFRKMMALAVNQNLPAAIHMRGAEEEMVEELKAMKERPGGQFHCFGGSQEFLKLVLEMGYFVSYGGNITFKSAEKLRELLRMTPLERLLLETDSPYLSPEPLRGKVNTPANVKIIAEFMAKELGLSLAELSETTSNNAKCLYSLDI